MDKRDRQFHTYRDIKNQTGKTRLTPSMEDYLEMIYRHCKNEGYVRIFKLSELLNVQAPPSPGRSSDWLTWALWTEKYGLVKLTQEGRRLARSCWSVISL